MSRFDEIQRLLAAESPLPDDLPRIYLLGDTGAGKTTLVRKLLGTEASTFPTTRQTRTTVATTEYVIWQRDGYDLAAVLKPMSEVEAYVEEILSSAIAMFYRGRDREGLERNLRETSDQKFRLYYLLDPVWIADRVVELVDNDDLKEKVDELRREFPDDEDIDDCVDWAIEEIGEPYDSLKASILNEIQNQIAATCDGKRLGETWGVFKYESSSRDDFLGKCKAVLSSERYSIAPVIEHARIRGRLCAPWITGNPGFIIIDGEGIGHDTKEAGQLDVRHYDYFYQSDLILLVEESKRPFVAGGKIALKSIFQKGYGDKFSILFTKLEEVEPYDSSGDPTDEDRINVVKAGLRNVLGSLREERVKIDLAAGQKFFIGGLKSDDMNSAAIDTVNEILALSRELSKPEIAFAKPKYDYEKLSDEMLSVSTKKFHDCYDDLLSEAHWKTVEAFNRRMVMKKAEGFRKFTPITDFVEKISKEIESFIANPESWEREVRDTQKRKSLDRVRREFTKLMIDFARETIIECPHQNWRKAYEYRGRGSTGRRKNDIEKILRRSVPLFTAVQNAIESMQNAKEFKDHIKELLRQAVENCAGWDKAASLRALLSSKGK
ncbi:MAG: ATP-binding protein [Candidatus Accumulibacter sp.]|jgi:hypothetical protein|nr:ATP-binding protein [Accumulibacter sp.]